MWKSPYEQHQKSESMDWNWFFGRRMSLVYFLYNGKTKERIFERGDSVSLSLSPLSLSPLSFSLSLSLSLSLNYSLVKSKSSASLPMNQFEAIDSVFWYCLRECFHIKNLIETTSDILASLHLQSKIFFTFQPVLVLLNSFI